MARIRGDLMPVPAATGITQLTGCVRSFSVRKIELDRVQDIFPPDFDFADVEIWQYPVARLSTSVGVANILTVPCGIRKSAAEPQGVDSCMIGFMPNAQPIPVAYQSLYESPLFSVSDYRCHDHKGGPSAEEYSEHNSIVLMRHGAFAMHFGKRRVTADVNQAVFFSKNSVYRISHPAELGDRGTSFLVAPRILNDIVRELDPTIDEHPDQPFAFVTSRCDTQLFWRYRELVRRLEHSAEEPLEHLWADVTALEWVAEVLESAFEKHGKPAGSRRTSTKTDHAEKTEAARAFLASHMSQPVMLAEVAHEVAASPFNFARIFQQQTGLPIHRYLTLLRLRASLELLFDGQDDLTKLALDLGFSSHSHFTNIFRREFGHAPSEVRKNASSSKFRQMSKNLIV